MLRTALQPRCQWQRPRKIRELGKVDYGRPRRDDRLEPLRSTRYYECIENNEGIFAVRTATSFSTSFSNQNAQSGHRCGRLIR
jgi:hypothetical protein